MCHSYRPSCIRHPLLRLQHLLCHLALDVVRLHHQSSDRSHNQSWKRQCNCALSNGLFIVTVSGERS